MFTDLYIDDVQQAINKKLELLDHVSKKQKNNVTMSVT